MGWRLCECGSGVTSLQQRQIEGTDFDNVKKEISFSPLGIARQADKMAGWSGRICFHPLTSVFYFRKTRRATTSSFNAILFSRVTINNAMH